jgi:hypothetical protein
VAAVVGTASMISVLVTDSGSANYEHNAEYFGAINEWAAEHCESYRGYHVQDVADVSLVWDEIAEYLFESEVDEVLFRLKWL